jgi:biotin transport system permease protein
LGLAGAAVALVLTRETVAALVGLVSAILVLVSTLPPPRATLRGMVPIVVVAVLMGGYQWWRGDRSLAVEFTADFLAISCLALALTTSTPMDQAMGLVSRAAHPFRRTIPPEAVGLVFALTARAIPQITMILKDSADAAKARGLGRSVRATVVPATVRTFGWALAVGEAITARGIAETAPSDRRP